MGTDRQFEDPHTVVASIRGGFAWGILHRDYIDDVIHSIIRENAAKRTGMHKEDCNTWGCRGSHFPRGPKKIYKSAKREAEKHRRLILVGKSLGVYNWKKMLSRDASILEGWNQVILICVDGNHGPRIQNRNEEEWLIPGLIDHAVNFYTTNGRLAGAKIDVGGHNINKINNPMRDFNHFGIIGARDLRTKILDLLSKADKQIGWI